MDEPILFQFAIKYCLTGSSLSLNVFLVFQIIIKRNYFMIPPHIALSKYSKRI
jgi:hypothetical protein